MTAFTGGMFPADTDTWLGRDLYHPHRVVVADQAVTTEHPLELVSGTVTIDEAWSPSIQADLIVTTPEAPALAMLSPRTRNLVLIWPTYRDPATGTVRQSAWPWALYIRRRRTNRLTGLTALTLASSESLAHDWQWTDAAMSLTVAATTTCGAGISQMLAFTGAVPAFSSVIYTSTATAGTDLVLSTDTPSLWTAVQELADRAACAVWADIGPTLGRDWRLEPSPTAPSSARATTLVTGPAGFVTAWTEDESRDGDWYNAAMLVYTAGGLGPVRATEAAGGPGGSSTAGKRAYVERRNATAPAVWDNRAADAIVQRSIRRGIEHTIDAVAAYWLQPRWSVYLPDNTLVLVKRVAFDLAAGSMTLTTRSA